MLKLKQMSKLLLEPYMAMQGLAELATLVVVDVATNVPVHSMILLIFPLEYCVINWKHCAAESFAKIMKRKVQLNSFPVISI